MIQADVFQAIIVLLFIDDGFVFVFCFIEGSMRQNVNSVSLDLVLQLVKPFQVCLCSLVQTFRDYFVCLL